MSKTKFRIYGSKAVPKLLDKVEISSIVNDTTSGGTSVPLAAEQGKVLRSDLNGEIARSVQAIVDLKDGVDTDYNTLNKLANKQKQEVLDRESSVENEVTNRNVAVGNEASIRAAADGAIRSDMDAQKSVLETEIAAAKSVLQTNIDNAVGLIQAETQRASTQENNNAVAIANEITARQADISNMTTLLNTETTNRMTVESSLDGRVKNIENGNVSGIIPQAQYDSMTSIEALDESKVLVGWGYFVKETGAMYLCVSGTDGDYKPASWTSKSFIEFPDWSDVLGLVNDERNARLAQGTVLQNNIDAANLMMKTTTDAIIATQDANNNRAIDAENSIRNSVDALKSSSEAADAAEVNSRKAAIDAVNGRVDSAISTFNTSIDAEKLARNTQYDVLVAADKAEKDRAMGVESGLDSRLQVVEGDELTTGSVKKALFDAKSYADATMLRKKVEGRQTQLFVQNDSVQLVYAPCDGLNGIFMGEILIYGGENNQEAISAQIKGVTGSTVFIDVDSMGQYDTCEAVVDYFYRNIDQVGSGQGVSGQGGAGA